MKAYFFFEAERDGNWLVNAELDIEMQGVLPVGTEIDIWEGDPAKIAQAVVNLCDMSVRYFFEDFTIDKEDCDELMKGLEKRGWSNIQPLEFGEPDA